MSNDGVDVESAPTMVFSGRRTMDLNSSVMFALFLENIPMLFFSLPLIVAASVVFAATHHESPPVIWRATIEWVMWLVGILGAVLVVVFILSHLA